MSGITLNQFISTVGLTDQKMAINSMVFEIDKWMDKFLKILLGSAISVAIESDVYPRLVKARVSTSQMIKLAEVFYSYVKWKKAIRHLAEINRIRNAIAHPSEPPEFESKSIYDLEKAEKFLNRSLVSLAVILERATNRIQPARAVLIRKNQTDMMMQAFDEAMKERQFPQKEEKSG